MQHRGFDFTIVQGIERDHWKWSVNVAGILVLGNAVSKAAATEEAVRAIDRALVPRRLKLVPPDTRDE